MVRHRSRAETKGDGYYLVFGQGVGMKKQQKARFVMDQQ